MIHKASIEVKYFYCFCGIKSYLAMIFARVRLVVQRAAWAFGYEARRGSIEDGRRKTAYVLSRLPDKFSARLFSVRD